MIKLLSKVSKEVYFFSLVYFLFILIGGLNYPIFRDEFYYLDCSNHLSAGYVDHPAFSIFILKIWTTIFGESQLSIRIIPALLGASLLILSSLINIELGGSKYSGYLTIVCVALMPTTMANFGYYSMNCWEIFIWTLLFYFVVKLINTRNEKNWITVGIILGIGFNNKIGIIFLIAALVISLVLAKERKCFKSKYFWIGAAIIFVSMLPYSVWNIQNNFATKEFIDNAAKYKNAEYSVLSFLKSQITDYGPANAIFWITGLISLIIGANKKYKLAGLTFLICLILFLFTKAKPYYTEGLYPFMVTAGAVSTAAFFEKRNLTKVKYAVLIVLFLFKLVPVPIVVPVLSVDNFIIYQNLLGLNVEGSEKHTMGVLPQFYADRFGWEEMTDKIARIYNSLPENEKKHTFIFAQNYGEAGAINYYGKKYNLPFVYCPHNNHFIWGSERKDTVSTMIILGGEREDHLKYFSTVEVLDSTSNELSMPYENNLGIFIGRNPKVSLKDMWKDLKIYI
ncbi:MAG: glycosyltransferase family 39 protein [Ignavibacteria bacterium]|nr:glycosyltransferase family 39 protein [Ignavibacteria bacterium]